MKRSTRPQTREPASASGQEKTLVLVMAVSAHAMSGHAESAKEAGADAFVPKPCLPQDVEHKIRDLLKPRKLKAK